MEEQHCDDVFTEEEKALLEALVLDLSFLDDTLLEEAVEPSSDLSWGAPPETCDEVAPLEARSEAFAPLQRPRHGARSSMPESLSPHRILGRLSLAAQLARGLAR